MILVDTSVIVAWLDREHDHHEACTEALDRASQADELGISTVTYAEPASGARTREHVDVTDDRRRTKAWAGLDWIWT